MLSKHHRQLTQTCFTRIVSKNEKTMKKIITLLIFLNYLFNPAQSQETEKSHKNFSNLNSVQFEIMGGGGFYSLNYERIIFNGQNFKTTGQIGLSFYPRFIVSYETFIIPISLNEIISFNKNHIEFGLGGSIINEDLFRKNERSWGYLLTGRLGYRYQKPEGKFLFRAGFVPLFNFLGDFYPWGALSIGYSFN